jgi:transcriptional regulator with XRE-family HTH domain
VERGVRNPSLTALVSLAGGLGISVSHLLETLEIEADLKLIPILYEDAPNYVKLIDRYI